VGEKRGQDMPGNDEKLQRQLEELTLALQDSEARFKSVVIGSVDGIIVVDKRGVIKFANPAVAALFKRSEETLLGENFGFPIIDGETTELDIVQKGADAVVEMRVTNTEWDGSPAHLLTLRDITERRRAEEALIKSEERYRALFTTLIVGFCTIEVIFGSDNHPLDFRFLEVNPAFEAQTGIQNAQGRLARELVPELEANWCEIYGKIALTGESARFINEVRSLNRCYDVYAYRVGRPEDRQVAIVFNDITDRIRNEESIKKLNAELAVRAAELESANKELDAFNYTVAHDLRNPLNVISGYCQVIRELCSARLDEPCKEYIAETYKGTMRMNGLIDALLNFSRMGHAEPHREMVNLFELAHDVTTMLRLSDPERQVEFRINDKIEAFADKNLMLVVLNNLIGNAWKYTSMKTDAVIEFSMTDNGGRPVYIVRDNGAGFHKEDANKLFLPFQRLHGPEQFKGFGIGLATVERIINRHGGKIWGEGEPGKGATFYFTLSQDEVST
jgi:signal transduction histidine kinase